MVSPFDVLTLSAVVDELRQTIISGRMTHILPAGSRALCFTIGTGATRHNLLVSVDPVFFRLHLSTDPPTGPAAETPFLATLRSHCRNATVRSISQREADRVAIMELGRQGSLLSSSVRLVIELTGRLSNLLIVRPEDGIILDCWRHIDARQCRYRQLLPGLPYLFPPLPQGLHPVHTDAHRFHAAILEWEDEPVLKGLTRTIQGLGRVLASECIFRAGVDPHSLISSLDQRQIELMWETAVSLYRSAEAHRFTPTLFLDALDVPVACSPFDLKQFASAENRRCAGISQALQIWYGSAVLQNETEGLRQGMISALGREIAYWQETRQKLFQELETASRHEDMQRTGEIILANIDRLRQGMNSAQVVDYFQEGQPLITLGLDPERSPQENATALFRKARKARQGLSVIRGRLHRAQERLQNLQDIISELHQTQDRNALLALRNELAEKRLLVSAETKTTSARTRERSFRTYLTSTGWTVLAGRDNKDNDRLTFGEAAPDDMWFHARGASGSHVVLKRENRKQSVDKTTLEEAAGLAAFLSKARGSKVVPVSYTEKKYVRRSRGAPPGTVFMDRAKTLIVAPQTLPRHPGRDDHSTEDKPT